MKKTMLKGGSLAGTYLIEDGNKKIVRKEISLNHEREYGYVRWYSQLKRLQRYEKMFPGAFVKMVDYGVQGLHSERFAYFDLEYHVDAVNCHDYICGLDSPWDVGRVFDSIMDKLKPMHKVSLTAPRNSIKLYFQEEVTRKLDDCILSSKEFVKMYLDTDICSMLHELEMAAYELYENPCESYTHGNVTLENILYLKDSQNVIFIDPYEENIIDNKYNEYSQLAQSCNSHYELMCSSPGFTHIPLGLDLFNLKLKSFMKESLSENEIRLVKFFECSQFFRMLPFKLKAGLSLLEIYPFLKKAEKLAKEVLHA